MAENFELEFLRNLIPSLSPLNVLTGNEDAVAWHTPEKFKNQLYVCNVDTMAWSSDALPTDMTLEEFGAKLVSITLSDLVAKGAQPHFFLCSINGPIIHRSRMKEIVTGIRNKCHLFGVAYLGGDLNGTPNSSSEWVLTGVGIGFVSKKSLIKRSTAQIGDIICVSGPFGYTGLGYAHFLEKKIDLPADHVILSKIREKLINPQLRIELLLFLRKYATSAIDSSDGLAISLFHLSQASNVQINVDALPVPKKFSVDKTFKAFAKEHKLDLLDIIMYAGEEYEIVFTVKESDYDLMCSELQEKNLTQPIKIGKVKQGSTGVFYKNQLLQIKGWDSLSKNLL